LEGSPNFILLRVENIGSGPAYKIQLKAGTPFEMANGQDLGELGIFRRGIGYLAPKCYVEHFLISLVGVFEELAKTPLQIQVAYEDSLGKGHQGSFLLDFGEMENLAWIGTPPLNELARSVKEIKDDFHRLSTGFNKLEVLTQPLAEYRHRLSTQSLAWSLEQLTPEQLERVQAVVNSLRADGEAGSELDVPNIESELREGA
jgi:hypothetical protein